MERKRSIIFLILVLAGSFLAAGEALSLPGKTGMFHPPAGWTTLQSEPLIVRGPARDAGEAPRLVVTLSEGDPASAAATLRDGWKRVADGCEFLDDDDVPLGGRVWRRIRVRFAAGPLAFGQTAWIGQVAGRTMVIVLSAPDDRIGGYLAVASATVASITLAP